MLHHLSIPARDPQRVATALAELLGGDVTEFGPVPGAFIAWARDETGTAIDCLPLGTELRPGVNDEEARFAAAEHPSPFGATHAALSVDRTEEEIQAVADREGWRAVRCDRGSFSVIEFWVENALMLEFLTPEMAADYLAAVRPT
jgi:catechol 2,3-dioxygenase-like lactoylglutathione lyase family enzyme